MSDVVMVPGAPEIYDPATFRFGAQALATLREAAQSSPATCRTICTLFPATTYERPAPRLLDSAEPDFAARMEVRQADINRQPAPAAAIVLLQIADAVISGCAIHLPKPGGYDVLYKSLRQEDNGDYELRSAVQLDDARTEYVGRSDQALLFISGRGWFNYGHSLVDDVPRAAAVRALHAQTGKPVTILLQSHSLPLDVRREQAMRAMLPTDIPCGIAFIDPHCCYRVTDLFYVTPVTSHPIWKSPEALTGLATTIRGRFAPAPRGGRIFVPRRRSLGRAIANQEEIQRILAAHGFVAIDADGMGFEAQVTAFAGARVIVGVMGAAMCNTVFCDPATRLGYLAPAGWTEPFYWDLAAVCRHAYHVCYGTCTEPNRPPNQSSFEISPAQLARLLERLL